MLQNQVRQIPNNNGVVTPKTLNEVKNRAEESQGKLGIFPSSPETRNRGSVDNSQVVGLEGSSSMLSPETVIKTESKTKVQSLKKELNEEYFIKYANPVAHLLDLLSSDKEGKIPVLKTVFKNAENYAEANNKEVSQGIWSSIANSFKKGINYVA